MSLTPEQAAEIHRLVWSGMWSKTRLIEIATEEIDDPDNIDADAAVAAIEQEIQANPKRNGPGRAQTDVDRLQRLFDALNASGLAAIMNAGTTMSDGLDDVGELCDERGGPGPGCFGYCFFHSQDLDRAMNGEGLWLAFGDFSEEPAKMKNVGELVVKKAREHGFNVEWEGQPNHRIMLTPIVWRKRGMPED